MQTCCNLLLPWRVDRMPCLPQRVHSCQLVPQPRAPALVLLLPDLLTPLLSLLSTAVAEWLHPCRTKRKGGVHIPDGSERSAATAMPVLLRARAGNCPSRSWAIIPRSPSGHAESCETQPYSKIFLLNKTGAFPWSPELGLVNSDF
jgi:hypothetical protein